VKLAEIGTTTHENQVIHQSDMLRGIWLPNAKLIIYTEEQRRELVRACLTRMFTNIGWGGVRFVASELNGMQKAIEAMIEEEGL
jgi:hypothetical protein